MEVEKVFFFAGMYFYANIVPRWDLSIRFELGLEVTVPHVRIVKRNMDD